MNADTYNAPATAGGNREDLRNILTIIEPEETPFTSMTKKVGEASATFTEVLADTLRKPRKGGTKEGQDGTAGGNKATNRKRFGTYQNRFMDTYGVTDVQEAIAKRGGVAAAASMYGEAKAKCVRELKRDMEATYCSTQEHQAGSADADMQTRGAFTWLSVAAQASNPVDANFRTLAGSVLSGVGTSVPLFTEAQFNGLFKTLKSVYGGKREFDVIGGNNVIETVDNFTRVQPSSTNNRYNVWEDADEHEITLMVQVFESSFGRANMIPTEFNRVDANGDPDANSALILNQELWLIDFLDNLHSMDNIDKGGGPTGYCRAMAALLCLNPKGNGQIYNT